MDLLKEKGFSESLKVFELAHEVRAPLAYAMAHLELLSEQLDREIDPEKMKQGLGHIQEGLKRIQKLVQAVIPSLTSEVSPIRRTLVDIKCAIEHSVRLVEHELRDKAKMTLDIESGLPNVLAEELELSQVIVNLLQNAAQAITPGDCEGNRIHVQASRYGKGAVRLKISDTGCGISESLISKVFDPFFTTKKEGTGLGLVICKDFVTSWGGSIQVESKVGRGSTFTIELSTFLEKKKVLVADDDRAMVTALETALQDEYEVIPCASGSDVIQALCQDESLLCALCDMFMGSDKGGIDIFTEVSRKKPGAERKIIFMTGGGFTPETVEFLKKVSNQKLGKPFSLKDLRVLLANLRTSTELSR